MGSFSLLSMSSVNCNCLQLMCSGMKLDNVHRDTCCLKSDKKLNKQKNDKKVIDKDRLVPYITKYNDLIITTDSIE